MNDIQPVNVCVFSYEQHGKIFNATSSSVESKDHAIEQGLMAFEKIQLEEQVIFKLLEIYSEWKPSELLIEKIKSTYPGVSISYSFEEGL